jgi:hypothetical protein
VAIIVWCVLPISIGLAIGPSAWFSSEFARPSQKKFGYSVTAWLTKLGALRPPFCARMPDDTGVGSENAFSGR